MIRLSVRVSGSVWVRRTQHVFLRGPPVVVYLAGLASGGVRDLRSRKVVVKVSVR